jgi:hypothetical protein
MAHKYATVNLIKEQNKDNSEKGVMDNLPRTGICDQALLELNFKSLMKGDDMCIQLIKDVLNHCQTKSPKQS